MDPLLRWQDPAGQRTIDCIIKKRVPQWNTGLRDWQLPLVAKILDGEDVLCCTATGDGKSALFAAPIIVLREMSKNAHEYENLPCRVLPVGLVVTPTKGLSANIVKELAGLGVSALAYCKETVTEARKAGRKLAHEIKECKTWSVVCIDPEHLKDPDWREITDYPVFRSNIVYGCVDEAHLIKEWGRAFRLSFKLIGAFFRGRLPPRTATLALSVKRRRSLDTNAQHPRSYSPSPNAPPVHPRPPPPSAAAYSQDLGPVRTNRRLLKKANENVPPSPADSERRAPLRARAHLLHAVYYGT